MEAFAVGRGVNDPRTESPLNICPARESLWDAPRETQRE
jgi:hypothetical protein